MSHPRHRRLAQLTTGLLALLPATVQAQYNPAPPRPYPGYINDYLRTQDPYNSQWDVGLNLRARFEDKEQAGFTSAGSNRDFADGRPANALNEDRFDNNNSYLLTRVMPRVGYTDKWWAAFTEFRSSNSFDDERGDNGTSYTPTNPIETAQAPGIRAGNGLAEKDSDLNLHQAFVFVGNHKEFPVSAKLGRQELVPGGLFPTPAGKVGPDQRQVGHFRWNNNARVFDAAKVRYQAPWFGVDVWTGAVVYNDDGNFNESHYSDDKFNGVYVNFPRLSSREVIETYVYQRDVDAGSADRDWSGVAAPFRNPQMQELYTGGLRVKSIPLAYGGWDYSVELMHQFGSIHNRSATGDAVGPVAPPTGIKNAPKKDQDAYAAILGGGYTWTESAWQPRLGFIYSYATGDANAIDGTSETFQNQFATTHLHYGYMDLSSLQNIHDIRTAFTFKPVNTVTVAIEHHLQLLEDTNDYWYNVAGVARVGGTGLNGGNGYNRSGNYDPMLGNEFDLVVGWYPLIWMHVEVGASYYFAGKYIEQTWANTPGGNSDAAYFYTQLTLNF